MGWLKSILGFFTGSSGAKAAEIVDEAVFTSQEKATEDKQFTAEILANTGIDLFNRLVRPGITLYYVGGFAEWWKLPDVSKIDPVHFQIFMIIVTFWFGGRVLLKDLPNAVAAILKTRRG